MEFHEKLQQLRKKRGLTQEALAEHLYVSRTAVSKWESGRGYPNIDSLKAIAAFYAVSIDDLLSGSQALTIAEEDSRTKENHFRDLVFGLLDVSAAMFFFLPLFGETTAEGVHEASLLSMTALPVYLRAAYCAVIAGMIISGILTLALQSCRHPLWLRGKRVLSLAFHAAGTLLFIISPQPYAAAFLFVFLAIKALMLAKKP